MRVYIKKYRAELLLFCIALFACASVFALPRLIDPRIVPVPENTFTHLAKNILERGIYADDNPYTPPLSPHSTYTPLYPLFIAPVIWSPTLVLILNWILRGILVVLLYRAARVFNVGEKIAFWTSTVFALEPYQLVLTNNITAESLFSVLLMIFTLALWRYYENPNIKTLVWASLFLGLSTLTRPVAEFLVFFTVLAILFSSKRNLKIKTGHALLSVFIFIAVLAPWLIRNHTIYGYWSLSSLPAHQMLNANIPFFLEWQNRGKNASETSILDRIAELRIEASKVVGKDLTKRYTVDIAEAEPIMKKIAIPFYEEHWKGLTIFYLSQFPFQMLTDNWRTALEHITGLRQEAITPLSAAHAASEGNILQLLAPLRHFNAYVATFLLGKLYWLIAYILALIGFIVLWKKPENRAVILFFSFLILYLPFLSLPYLEARYRFPSTPYVFVLAAVGLAWLLPKIARLRSRLNI